MKNLNKLLLAVLLALVSSASAFGFEVDGIYYNVLSEEDRTCEVIHEFDFNDDEPLKYGGDIVIPSTVTYCGRTYTVTKIGDGAFNCYYSGSGTPRSVSIPNTIKEIGNEAFYGCYKLKTLIIPNSVTKIGSGAFYGCSGLISITIPNSVTKIDSSTFSGCI